jgi:peroxiredoxin
MKDKYNLVGTKIKEFSLPNSRNETTNIREFEGNKNVVIVLFRNKS